MKDKVVAFFGAGSIAEKTSRTGDYKPVIIFDNNSDLYGTKNMGIDIKSPDEIDEYIDLIEQIVITTTSFTEVEKQLKSLGISDDKIIISPVLKSLMYVERLETFSGSYLFTSGLPSFSNDLSGGGLYLLKIEGKSFEFDKIYSGNCHGLMFDDSSQCYFLTDNNRGIVVLNKELIEQYVIKTEHGLRPHGISFIDDDRLALGCSFDDSVLIINKKDGAVLSRVGLSNQKLKYQSPQHHLNDVWCDNGTIYASMFSISGNWKRGVFDGGVVMFNADLSSDSVGEFEVILDHLQMPHNFQIHADNHYLCNSLDGQILGSNREVIFQSNGFVRGVYATNTTLIVGESRNRNFANINSKISNPCIDSYISIIDRESGAYRSIQIPADVSEVHSIRPLL
jgi:hypothetical protein